MKYKVPGAILGTVLGAMTGFTLGVMTLGLAMWTIPLFAAGGLMLLGGAGAAADKAIELKELKEEKQRQEEEKNSAIYRKEGEQYSQKLENTYRILRRLKHESGAGKPDTAKQEKTFKDILTKISIEGIKDSSIMECASKAINNIIDRLQFKIQENFNKAAQHGFTNTDRIRVNNVDPTIEDQNHITLGKTIYYPGQPEKRPLNQDKTNKDQQVGTILEKLKSNHKLNNDDKAFIKMNLRQTWFAKAVMRRVTPQVIKKEKEEEAAALYSL